MRTSEMLFVILFVNFCCFRVESHILVAQCQIFSCLKRKKIKFVPAELNINFVAVNCTPIRVNRRVFSLKLFRSVTSNYFFMKQFVCGTNSQIR